MTLDEAIKHAEEVVERNEEKASWFFSKEGNPNYKNCVECAKEHRQLAEWLKELKQLREQLRWTPCSERPPKCEQDVLICTKPKKHIDKNSGFEWYEDSIITPAMYEDGTMLEVDSKWHWEDIDYAEWDEDEDCGIIPEGWWENRYFNQDGVYNNPVDKEVVAWMPLPKPYKAESEK